MKTPEPDGFTDKYKEQIFQFIQTLLEQRNKNHKPNSRT